MTHRSVTDESLSCRALVILSHAQDSSLPPKRCSSKRARPGQGRGHYAARGPLQRGLLPSLQEQGSCLPRGAVDGSRGHRREPGSDVRLARPLGNHVVRGTHRLLVRARPRALRVPLGASRTHAPGAARRWITRLRAFDGTLRSTEPRPWWGCSSSTACSTAITTHSSIPATSLRSWRVAGTASHAGSSSRMSSPTCLRWIAQAQHFCLRSLGTPEFLTAATTFYTRVCGATPQTDVRRLAGDSSRFPQLTQASS